VAPPVFKTGLAGNTLAGRFDSFPPPPPSRGAAFLAALLGDKVSASHAVQAVFSSTWCSQSLKHATQESGQPNIAPTLRVGVAGAPCARCRRAFAQPASSSGRPRTRAKCATRRTRTLPQRLQKVTDSWMVSPPFDYLCMRDFRRSS
jgi:hypothetical protein